MHTLWKMGSQTGRLQVLQKGKNNGKSANLTSETKKEKDVALITDIPSGNETALLK